MSNGWTAERRKRQSEMIQNWKPWEKSTGPRTTEGKAVSSRNAFKGGSWRLIQEIARLVREQNDLIKRL